MRRKTRAETLGDQVSHEVEKVTKKKGKRISMYTVGLFLATIATFVIRVQTGQADTPYWQHLMLTELTPFVFAILTFCSFLMD